VTSNAGKLRGKNLVRGLSAFVVLLLIAAGLAMANRSHPAAKAAIGRAEAPSTSTSDDPTTSTEPSTTVAPATTAPPSTAPRAATTRTAAPRSATTAKPKPAPAPPPPPSGFTAAFYYGWYPSSFSNPGTKYHPTAGQYSSNDPATVKNQIDQMRYAGMQAGIFSWWGAASSPGLPYGYQQVDRAFGVALQAAHGTPFQWAVYFESGSPAFGDRSTAGLQSYMTYIRDHYANDPNYLHMAGRPVIFVWPNAGDGCDMVQRWHDANIGFYIVQKRFTGWQSCQGAADSWHEYSPNVYSSVLNPYSYAVSPGFNRYDSQGPYLARDPAQFDKAVAAMAAAAVQWKLVTTFNEWGEGTAVEPAAEWGNTYLDILHAHLGSR
jgi:Glycosyl hydrolase family 99